MPDPVSPTPLVSPAEMRVVERVLKMRGGDVLDLNNQAFDQFIGHEVGADATAPRFAEDGGSKAKRLRRSLPSLTPERQVKLLRAFLRYRDSATREGQFDELDEEWRNAYPKLIE